MPKITRKFGPRKNRKTSRPNVFAQSQPTRRPEGDAQAAVTTSTAEAGPRLRARVERTTRIAGARSEIYTRSLPAELKKMGVLAGVIVVALIVLTLTV